MGLGDTLFGKKARAAKAIPFEELKVGELDIGKEAQEAIDITSEVLPEATDVTQAINLAAQEEAISLREKALPGFKGFQEQLGSLFTEAAVSPFEIPEGALDVLKQQAAEAGVSGGFGGQSEFGKFNLLRNIGRESLTLGNQRLQQASQFFNQLVATAPSINPLSVTAFTPTLGATAGAEQFNIQNQAQVDQFNIIGRQATAQFTENQAAAASGSQGILGGIVAGGLKGFAAGGPLGAIIGATAGGGLAAAGVGAETSGAAVGLGADIFNRLPNFGGSGTNIETEKVDATGPGTPGAFFGQPATVIKPF